MALLLAGKKIRPKWEAIKYLRDEQGEDFSFLKNVPEMKVKRTAKEGKTIEDGSKNITMKHNPMAEIILKSSH